MTQEACGGGAGAPKPLECFAVHTVGGSPSFVSEQVAWDCCEGRKEEAGGPLLYSLVSLASQAQLAIPESQLSFLPSPSSFLFTLQKY